MVKFEGYDRRIDKINKSLKENGIESLEEAKKICLDKGIDVEKIVKGIQPIAFENAVWAYTYDVIAIKKGVKRQPKPPKIESASGFLRSALLPKFAKWAGAWKSAAKLFRDETKCFAFVAGHESFAAAEKYRHRKPATRSGNSL